MISATVAASTGYAAPVTAKSANSFVASCGTSAHWNYPNVYTTQYTAIRDKLVSAGFRIVRGSGTMQTPFHG